MFEPDAHKVPLYHVESIRRLWRLRGPNGLHTTWCGMRREEERLRTAELIRWHVRMLRASS